MLEDKIAEPTDREGLISGLKRTLNLGYLNSLLYGVAMPLSWLGSEMAANGNRPGLAVVNYLCFSFSLGYFAYNSLGVFDTKMQLNKQNEYLQLERNFD